LEVGSRLGSHPAWVSGASADPNPAGRSNASSTSATSSKKVLATGLLLETREVQQDVAHRAARLYRFDERKYRQLAEADSTSRSEQEV